MHSLSSPAELEFQNSILPIFVDVSVRSLQYDVTAILPNSKAYVLVSYHFLNFGASGSHIAPQVFELEAE